MYAQERQQDILRRARQAGRVDVVTLAEGLAVTTETIRRDLTVLERAGVVRRVHGGALPGERLGDGGVITAAGPPTGRLAGATRADGGLPVVVNPPPLATLLAARSNL